MSISADDVERLTRMTSQLYAAIMISSDDEFWLWHPEIRQAYLWLISDVAKTVRDDLYAIVEKAA